MPLGERGKYYTIREAVEELEGMQHRRDSNGASSCATWNLATAFSMGGRKRVNADDVVADYLSRLAIVEKRKNEEIEKLHDRIKGRDSEVATLEQIIQSQLCSVRDLQREVDEGLAREISLEAEVEEQLDLVKKQNTKLRDYSETINTMLRTIKLQNETCSGLRREVESNKAKLAGRCIPRFTDDPVRKIGEIRAAPNERNASGVEAVERNRVAFHAISA